MAGGVDGNPIDARNANNSGSDGLHSATVLQAAGEVISADG